MNNLLLALAGALIVALAALFVGPYFIDWNSYRAVFEEQATRLAGRDVSVDGNVNLRLLPAPYVSFERVKIAGDGGETDAPLLEVENYTLWLAVPPLLQGEIEAQAMEIDRPKLRLALRADGSVNWADLGVNDVELPFVPRNVAFRDTNIRDAEIEIAGADNATLTRLTGISGTFTAHALNGPFKFIGDIASVDGAKQVRWSTGRFDENGGLRIKGTLKQKSEGITYAADGLIQKLTSRPVFTGAIAGKLRKSGSAGFEMKTDVYADTSGAQFRELTLLLDAEGRPQIINGDGSALWQGEGGVTAKLDLESRWLDIDRLIAGDEGGTTLLDRLDTATSFLAGALPADMTTTATFKATQVNFGAEALDEVVLKLKRHHTGTDLEKLTADLPGAASLQLNGHLSQGGATSGSQVTAFKGTVSLRGRTLSRFASWLQPSWGAMVKPVDGAFTLDATLALSPATIAIEDASGRLDETRFSGSLKKARDDAAPLALALSSPAVDLSRMFPDAGALGTAIRSWMNAPSSSAGDEEAGASAAIELAVGQLKVGASRFADVTVQTRLVDGALDITRATFSSANGLEFDATTDDLLEQGDAVDPAPVRFVLRAPDEAAYDELIALTGFEFPDTTLAQTSKALLPAHLAGSVERNTERAELGLRYDGTLAGNPAVGRIRLEGSSADWRNRIWTVTTDVALAKPDKLLSSFGVPVQSLPSVEEDGEGRLTLYAIGNPDKGLKTDFKLRSKSIALGFAGAVESASEGLRLSGNVTGQVSDNPSLASLLAIPTDVSSTLTFAARLDRAKGRTAFEDIQIAASGLSASGTATLTRNGDTTAVTISARSTKLSLPALMTLATSAPRTSATVDAENVSDTTVWSEAPFDFSALDGLTLNATVGVDTLTLSEGARVADAKFSLRGSSDRIEVADLSARVGAGTITAQGTLERRPAGAQVALSAKGTAIPVGHLVNGETDVDDADGTLAFEIAMNGIGLSPKGVVSVIQGEGRVTSADAALRRFSPQVVQDVAADIADENATIDTTGLKERLAERLSDRALTLGTQDVRVRVRDGAIQADTVKINTPASTITVTSFLDIARLRLDSEWRVAARPKAGAPALPPITVFYAGDIRELSQITPGFGVAALERELAVRRLEGNIDQLEGVRSLRLKENEASESGSASTSRGRLRPTIGGEREGRVEAENDQAEISEPTLPEPVRPRRRKRADDSLWQLNGAQPPPVELRLQTPEGAPNPT